MTRKDKITIESFVEIWPAKTSGGRKPKYPFADMNIGDSFECTENPPKIRKAAYHYRKRHNPEAQFSTRKTEKGCRVWRIK